MSSKNLFDVKHQLTFYGAYHSNSTNVMIHIRLIIASAQVMLAQLPVPSFLPSMHYVLSKYLIFDLNYSSILAAVYLAYYYILEPTAAFLYTPQFILSTLTANAIAGGGHLQQIAALHGVCWVAQFVGHGVAEKRAPALLDNLVGAIVLAPFFVHLEMLFFLGYKPQMHKELNNAVGVEIARVKKAEGDKRRAAAAKVQ
ncbi:unnamed protein product [Mycena citricolor]|uniref:DUF962-domain-containing protein n=1 Tax=Mycena citricolor TaxID=2018698 RepID=A0AAD2GSB2_9AGAR|nr:unnamed protein product [Mycena citricolor]